MSRLIPSYIEQSLRIEMLERAVIASEQDYKRIKSAAQAAYRAMVAMELSDGSKREWDTAVSGLRVALAEPAIKESLTVRPWVGLTEEEIESLQRLAIDPVDANGWGFLNRESYAHLIEAKLKEKNT